MRERERKKRKERKCDRESVYDRAIESGKERAKERHR